MFYLLEARPWYEVGANIATMISALVIVFLIIEYKSNRSLRNIQLMHRCIDAFREWSAHEPEAINETYLELPTEELFYFQKGLIEKQVAIEWIEGMLEYFLVFASNGEPLNSYGRQVSLEELDCWKRKTGFYDRVHYFIIRSCTSAISFRRMPIRSMRGKNGGWRWSCMGG